MNRKTRIHEVIHSGILERDAWYLVHDSNGRRYVLFETQLMETGFDPAEPCRKREIPVQAILMQHNELSRRLRSVLEE